MKHLGLIALCCLGIACVEEQEPEAKPIAEASGEGDTQTSGAAADNEVLVRGRIEVDSKLAVPENATLFIMGRPVEGLGPPVLVKRIQPVSFPLDFSLTGADRMMQGVAVPSDLTLSARLDQDGDAISRTPGDLTGEVKGVARGTTDLTLLLSDAIGGDGSN